MRPRVKFSRLRPFAPILVAFLVVCALAINVLPNRDAGDPPSNPEATPEVRGGDSAGMVPPPTETPTPDLTSTLRTPAMIVFELAKVTPTPRLIRRPAITPTATPTPEFLPEQFISNGGAEDQLEGWYVEPGIGVTTDPVHGGEFAILVASSGGFASNQIVVQPGRAYRLSAWGALSNEGETGQVGIGYFDATGQRLTLSEPPPLLFADLSFSREVLTFIPVPGVARVEVYLWKAPGSASFVVDDISVRAYSGEPASIQD